MSLRCPKCSDVHPSPRVGPGRHPHFCPRCRAAFTLVVEADHRMFLVVEVDPTATADERSVLDVPEESVWNVGMPSGGYHRRRDQSRDEADSPSVFGPPSLAGLRSSGELSLAGPRSSVGPVSGGLRPAPPKPVAVRPVENPPAVLGGYRLGERVTANDTGTVYAADAADGTPAALLLVHRSVADDSSLAARVGFAVALSARLGHPNLRRVRAVGLDAGVLFAAVEPSPPTTLADGLVQGQRLPPDTAVGLVLQAAEGLAYLHRHGVTHRRVHPGNLGLATGRVVKVNDWGWVHTAGPPPAVPDRQLRVSDYLAPELAAVPLTRDPRVDVFGLGRTLQAVLTGRRPAGPAEPRSMVGPADLDAIVARAAAPFADRRFQTMDDFIAALRQWQAERPPAVSDEDTAELATVGRRYARTVPKAGWAAAAAVGAAAVAGGLFAQYPVAAAGVLAFGPTFAAAVVGGAAAAHPLLAAAGRAADAHALTLTALVLLTAAGFGLAAAAVSGQLLAVVFGAAAAGALLGLLIPAAVAAFGRPERELADRAYQLLRTFRLRGLTETDVWRLLPTAVGPDWEPVARRVLGADAAAGIRAETEVPPRRPLVCRLADRLAAAEDRRAAAGVRDALRRLQLRRLERKQTAQAGRRAARIADELMRKADAVAAAADQPGPDHTYRAALEWYSTADGGTGRGWFGRAAGAVADGLAHPLVRAAAAVPLLAGGLLWVYRAGTSPAGGRLDELPVGGRLFDSLNPLAAGAVLLASVGWPGRRPAAAAGAAAVVAVLAPHSPLVPLHTGPLGPSHWGLLLAALCGLAVLVWSAPTAARPDH